MPIFGTVTERDFWKKNTKWRNILFFGTRAGWQSRVSDFFSRIYRYGLKPGQSKCSRFRILNWSVVPWLKLFQKAKTIIGPTIKTVSRLRPLESHSESNPTQKIAAPIIEEVSNLIPEHQKKVNIRIDHFLIFSDQGPFRKFQNPPKIFEFLYDFLRNFRFFWNR